MHDLMIAATGGFMGVTIAVGIALFAVKRYAMKKLNETAASTAGEFHTTLVDQSTKMGVCLLCNRKLENGAVPPCAQ